jgi:acyl-coenzyme A synthetase/AMP-(fatty) acid ligase
MVVGEEDNHWGQRVTAFIILKSNAQIDDLKKIAKKSLSSIEYPKDWKVVDAIPISEMGKLKE